MHVSSLCSICSKRGHIGFRFFKILDTHIYKNRKFQKCRHMFLISLKCVGNEWGLRGSLFGRVFGSSKNVPKDISICPESLISHFEIIRFFDFVQHARHPLPCEHGGPLHTNWPCTNEFGGTAQRHSKASHAHMQGHVSWPHVSGRRDFEHNARPKGVS